MTTVTSILLTFLLTGLIGNWLAQRWQQRNWMNQQRFLGEEKEYISLKDLWEQLSGLAAKRLWRMRWVLFAIDDKNDAAVQERLVEYTSVLSEWNEKFTPMCARLTLLTRWAFTYELDRGIQNDFVNAGLKLERLVKARLSNQHVDRRGTLMLHKEFDVLSGRLFAFNRDVLRAVERQRARTYYGVEVEYSKSNLEKFGNWQLLKALFKPGLKTLRITRPPSDSEPPIIARS
jgi:hypothetical protein